VIRWLHSHAMSVSNTDDETSWGMTGCQSVTHPAIGMLLVDPAEVTNCQVPGSDGTGHTKPLPSGAHWMGRSPGAHQAVPVLAAALRAFIKMADRPHRVW
jgi:hypothetical protein